MSHAEILKIKSVSTQDKYITSHSTYFKRLEKMNIAL